MGVTFQKTISSRNHTATLVTIFFFSFQIFNHLKYSIIWNLVITGDHAKDRNSTNSSFLQKRDDVKRFAVADGSAGEDLP